MELFLQFIALNYFDKQVRHQTHYFFTCGKLHANVLQCCFAVPQVNYVKGLNL